MNRNEKEYLVQKIRTQYTGKEHTELDELKELDRKVRYPASIFACIFGSVSALIMGSGMSLIMTDIGKSIGISESFIPGLALGIAGILMAVLNYPIYRKILNARRKKYAKQIVALSDKIMSV